MGNASGPAGTPAHGRTWCLVSATEAELILTSRQVVPGRLLGAGFDFHFEPGPKRRGISWNAGDRPGIGATISCRYEAEIISPPGLRFSYPDWGGEKNRKVIVTLHAHMMEAARFAPPVLAFARDRGGWCSMAEQIASRRAHTHRLRTLEGGHDFHFENHDRLCAASESLPRDALRLATERCAAW
jgi:hypothetical protein